MWNNEQRLKTIADLASRAFDDLLKRRPVNMFEVLEKIEFLTSMSSEFLEANKEKFLQTRDAEQHVHADTGRATVDSEFDQIVDDTVYGDGA